MADDLLPPDPNDSYYLTNCFACKAVAKPDQEYIRNYGGVVCFSCRAFFRRAYQNQTVGTFVCKSGGRCVVTRKNRRKCQKCRLDRCLEAGMSHLAILTDEQKKRRFRKMIMKRERELQEHQGGLEQQRPQPSRQRQRRQRVDESDLSSDMDLDSDTQSLEAEPFSSSQPTIPDPGARLQSNSHQDLVNQLVEIFETLTQSNPKFSQLSIIYHEDCEPMCSCKRGGQGGKLIRILCSNTRKIVDSYEATLATSTLDFISRMKSISFVKISREEILRHFSKMSDDFRKFAFKQRHFVKLDRVDQERILSRNLPIFIQLQLCFGFFALEETYRSDSQDSQVLAKKKWMKNYQQKLHLEKFNAATRLFKTDADLDEYGRLLSKLNFIKTTDSLKERSVLSQVVLYDRLTSLNLSNPEEGQDIETLTEVLFDQHFRFNSAIPCFHDLSDTLNKMSEFCASHFNTS